VINFIKFGIKIAYILDMSKIIINSGIFATVDPGKFDVLSKYKWYMCGGYAIRRIRFGINIPMHSEVVGTIPKGYVIHHINKNKLDNQKSNLLIVMTHYHKCLHQGLYQRRPGLLPPNAIIHYPMGHPATPSI
jgi:hypothetical protein